MNLPLSATPLLKSGSGQKPGGTLFGKERPLKGIPGNEILRIPSLMTLQNGSLFIASDIRYSNWLDGGGSDIVVGISADGERWDYQFPLYFCDSTDSGSVEAASFVDPICLQGRDGTIYLEANATPTGILATSEKGFRLFGTGTGFIDVHGTDRVALTTSYEQAFTCPAEDDGTIYPYYIGAAARDGFAPVLCRADDSATRWAVDNAFNLYEREGEGYRPLTQQQYTADRPNGTIIQQNVFFKDSVLHVYNTQYVWMATSKDNGATWSHALWNVKTPEERSLQDCCGHGAIAANGDLILPFYSVAEGRPPQVVLLYSRDDGATWRRSHNALPNQWGNRCSNESVAIPLSDGTIRVFFRSDGSPNRVLQYCDAVWDEALQRYVFGDVVLTDVAASNTCKVCGIRYSKPIDGAEAILVSAPADTTMRADGKIWVFLLRQNKRPELAYVWDCPHHWEPTSYGYADMTELADGRVGILYEPTYHLEIPTIQEICPGGIIG